MTALRPIALALGIVLFTSASAQCPTGNVVILSQGDVAAYGSNYPNCTTLPGDLVISTGMFINDLSAFGNVQTILGDLRLQQVLGGPMDFSGFGQLTYIGGDLEVDHTVPLRNFQGLGALQRVEGSVNVHDCDSLLDLGGLGGLSVVGGDLLLSNSKLTSIAGIQQLDTVYGNFHIGNGNTPTPATLPQITIPADLDHVGGSLRINSGFTHTVNGANGLHRIGGELVFGTCYSLTSIQGFDALRSTGGNLRLFGNQSLTSVTGFSVLDSVGGEFHVFANPILGGISGFPQLDFCEALTFEGNAALSTITGFADLDSTGFLRFTNNAVLMSITAFDHTLPLGNLQINDNPQLAYCHVQAVCDYIAAFLPGPSIFNNAVDCNSETEVNAFCIATGVSEPNSSSWGVYPNPTSGTLMLSVPVSGTASVVDPSGRTVLHPTIASGELDVRVLDPGHYILQVVHNGRLHRLRWVKE